MRILIVAIPRSGSTFLMHKISKEKNLKIVFEPFHSKSKENDKFINSKYIENEPNTILKTLAGNHYSKKRVSLNIWLDWITELQKGFDEVILLSRKNLISAAESFSMANWTGEWFSDYQYTKLPNLGDSITRIKKDNMYLEELSKKLNIPITYYEDIYDLNSPFKLRKGIEKPKKLF